MQPHTDRQSTLPRHHHHHSQTDTMQHPRPGGNGSGRPTKRARTRTRTRLPTGGNPAGAPAGAPEGAPEAPLQFLFMAARIGNLRPMRLALRKRNLNLDLNQPKPKVGLGEARAWICPDRQQPRTLSNNACLRSTSACCMWHHVLDTWRCASCCWCMAPPWDPKTGYMRVLPVVPFS